MYTPGMLTDVVREVKEAARVREDALLSRVRAIVDERSWSTDVNLKLCRDFEELKVKIVAIMLFAERKMLNDDTISVSLFQIQFNVMRAERNDTNARMSKMEDEIKSLRSVLSHVLNNGTRQNVPAYPMNSPSFNDREFSHSSARSGERHSRRYLNIDNASCVPHENEILSPHENRSTDQMQYVPGYIDNLHLNGHTNGVYSTPENEANDSDIMRMEKETLKLRKELQDVMDSKQKADSKIME